MAEILWNKSMAEAATLGKCNSFWEASGISFDSRTINKGDLFIALPGKETVMTLYKQLLIMVR